VPSTLNARPAGLVCAENFIETPAFEVAPELLTSRRTGAMMGELIGHYRIEQLIGVGGMGEIEP